MLGKLFCLLNFFHVIDMLTSILVSSTANNVTVEIVSLQAPSRKRHAIHPISWSVLVISWSTVVQVTCSTFTTLQHCKDGYTAHELLVILFLFLCFFIFFRRSRAYAEDDGLEGRHIGADWQPGLVFSFCFSCLDMLCLIDEIPPLPTPSERTQIWGLSQSPCVCFVSMEGQASGSVSLHLSAYPTTPCTVYCTSQRFASGCIIGRGIRGSSEHWPGCRVGLSIISEETCFESLWKGFWSLGIHCLSTGMWESAEKELKSFVRGLISTRTMRYSWKANGAVACGSVMMYHSSGSRILGVSQVDFDHARESLDMVSSHAAFEIDQRCCCQAPCCDHVIYPYPYAISLTKFVKHSWWVVLVVKNSWTSNLKHNLRQEDSFSMQHG